MLKLVWLRIDCWKDVYWLKLDVFKGQNKEELSMIEVAHAILEGKGDTIAFADLTNEVQNYLGKSDEEVRARLSQFYTDLNEDGTHMNLSMKKLTIQKMKKTNQLRRNVVRRLMLS